ncbi:unnamed protein product [Amoebophrya sp. A25]|nr:unnamed protein product [Amoebophrya sp. A25]|eukprot:GSA25T00020837001.1
MSQFGCISALMRCTRYYGITYLLIYVQRLESNMTAAQQGANRRCLSAANMVDDTTRCPSTSSSSWSGVVPRAKSTSRRGASKFLRTSTRNACLSGTSKMNFTVQLCAIVDASSSQGQRGSTRNTFFRRARRRRHKKYPRVLRDGRRPTVVDRDDECRQRNMNVEHDEAVVKTSSKTTEDATPPDIFTRVEEDNVAGVPSFLSTSPPLGFFTYEEQRRRLTTTAQVVRKRIEARFFAEKKSIHRLHPRNRRIKFTSPRRLRKVLALLFSSLSGYHEFASAQLAAQSGLAGVILEDLDCPCVAEDGTCFQPVCPKGMYKCCFDCTVSICDRHELGFYPTGALYLSERGVQECLQCHPGDYCSGCDEYDQCPSVDAKDSAGAQYDTPRVSPPGSVLDRECQRCPDGFEADFVKEKCVPPFRQSCDITLLEICISGCKENPLEDECQRMECRIFCANDQRDSNPECLDAHKEMCNEFNLPLVDPNLSTLPGIATTTEAPTVILTDDSGIATVAPFRQEVACNINCNSATSVKLNVWLLLLALSLATMGNVVGWS